MMVKVGKELFYFTLSAPIHTPVCSREFTGKSAGMRVAEAQCTSAPLWCVLSFHSYKKFSRAHFLHFLTSGRNTSSGSVYSTAPTSQ
jgi:hypothetical protein